MRDRKLRQRLGDIPIPDYEEEAYLQTLKAAGKINLHPERQRVSRREFFLGQLPFISRKVWAAKLILTAFLILGILETGVAPDQRTWPLLSVSAPLLCLANVNELCDICRPGMREILKAARHSPGEMLLVRLLVFGFWICRCVWQGRCLHLISLRAYCGMLFCILRHRSVSCAQAV